MTDRRRFIDVMTVVSCFAVVALHANAIYHHQPTGLLWTDVSFWHHLFIFGAPAFFMISGATLMEYRKRYDTKTFLYKRFWRAGVPFLFWSLVAFGIRTCIAGSVSLKEVVMLPLKICACDYMSTYWFFMTIFSAYLFMPLLSLASGRQKLLLYMIGIWFAAESLYPFLCHLVGFSVCNRITFPYVGGGVAYMILGYCLYAFDVKRKWRIVIYAAGIAAFAISWLASLLHLGRITGGYWAPLCVVYTSAIFLFLRQCDFTKMPRWILSVVDWVKPHTLGIYLLHVFVTDIIAVQFHWPIASFFYRTVAPIILVAMCVLVSKAFKRIPILKGVV